ncbi:protein tis11 [Anaeramoeba flamelloides]|uniref:Protein tis11 n=1 Tax=Anaeramoeba flamelloides TaxID=1746091 RepID=A0ABQ8YI68_9EUKA|nr:protein tis11 [Anaeramoeba flamelloides]
MDYQQPILIENQPSYYFYNNDQFSPLRKPNHIQMSPVKYPSVSGRISPTHHNHNHNHNQNQNHSPNHHHNHNHNHNHNHERPKSPKHNHNSPRITKNLKFKTEVCRNFFGEECVCEFGSRCNFIHYRDNPESIALGSIHALKLMGLYHHFSNRKKSSLKKKRLPIFQQLGNN